MMYIAMSYDHRLIDGKDSVIFVIRIKQLLENPDNKFIPEFVRRLLF
jgi:2-oxoglutarate dehydrogenase E2 component (dihydrolipoamide succinyltransferase)